MLQDTAAKAKKLLFFTVSTFLPNKFFIVSINQKLICSIKSQSILVFLDLPSYLYILNRR